MQYNDNILSIQKVCVYEINHTYQLKKLCQ